MANTDASGALPRLTRDLATARRDLSRHGYCLIAEALDTDALRTTRDRLVQQAEGEIRRGLDYRDGGGDQRLIDAHGRLRADAFTAAGGGVNQRLWMLANKGACFRDLIVHPLVDELVGHVLGRDFILSTLSANIAKPGGVRMGLHTDQWWMPQPVRPGADCVRPSELTRQPAPEFVEPDPSLGIAPAVVCNTMWMLSDFTASNGATEVVAGSHLSGAHPRPGDQSDYSIVQPEAPAGSLLVFDGRLWHGTGANRGNGDRLGVLATFCAPQFRQQENQTLGIDPDLWDLLPEKLKARLGFKVWNAYGRIESPAAGWVSPNPQRIGELKPD
ncbi:MAG: phytanoyl-CoA dioxygenase family protein [Pseudomonadales bacterium]